MEWCAEREYANETLRECAADCNDDEKTARQKTVKKWELIKDGLFDRIAPKVSGWSGSTLRRLPTTSYYIRCLLLVVPPARV